MTNPAIKISSVIKQRLEQSKVPFFANDNIASVLEDGDLVLLQQEVEDSIACLLESLVIDIANDHNSMETSKRIAKMLITETFKGRYLPCPVVTDFPNASNLDQIYSVGPIEFKSTCAHHHMPIEGYLYVGVHPSDRVLGLSKFHRIADWIFSRPSIQEESTVHYADTLERLLKPKGLAIIVKAKHLCCGHRGVRDSNSRMVTSVMRGTLLTDPSLKTEFMGLVNNL